MFQLQIKDGSFNDRLKPRSAINIRNCFTFLFSITVFLTITCLIVQHYSRSILNKPFVPVLRRPRSATVFFVPGGENNCDNQYNVVCKFWFYLRCMVFAHLQNMVIIPDRQGAIEKATEIVQPGDVILFVFRGGHNNHSEVPKELLFLTDRQKNESSVISKIRFGLFHIAPETGRTDWPWYSLSHFVIRMYWMGDHLPSHVMSVPIGPQFPNVCTPAFLPDSFPKSLPGDSNNDGESEIIPSDISSAQQCSCGSLKFTPFKKRQFLWSFTGSLRRNRGKLVKLISENEDIKDKGFMRIASRFGGDGEFGSRKEDNPKTSHLEAISKSKFVFAPCGNVMETHRIYEVIVLGAIPVIENCEPELSGFFPFRPVIVDGGPEGMIDFVSYYKDRIEEAEKLQRDLLQWWRRYSNELALNVSNIVYNSSSHLLRTPI